VKSVTQAGHVPGPYIDPKDAADLSKGMRTWPSLPRYSNGYANVQNRPGMLVETHMLKDYRTRVGGTYAILRGLLELVNRDADTLLRMNREADAATIAGGKASGRSPMPLLLVSDGTTEPLAYKGIRVEESASEISGSKRRSYTADPIEMTVPKDAGFRTAVAVVPPAAYIVPVEWSEVIDVLAAHGIRMSRTSRRWEGEVETYRCDEPRWNPRPFEGRQVLFSPGEGTPKSDAALGPCRSVREKLAYPAGSAVVPLDQRAAKVAIHLLEPQGPDSFVAWGFFNAIFEQKEFGEDYVVEKLAREMLAKDPKLAAEFEARLATDPKFAASPEARLAFFYDRSPWRDPKLGLYPVGRLGSLAGIPIAGKGTGR
jgi:hypothetical protein